MIDSEKLAPLLELLQKSGVEHIKMEGLELRFSPRPEPAPIPPKSESDPVAELVKMDDAKLVDMLFPTGTPADAPESPETTGGEP